MLKVKIFSAKSTEDLERVINNFLSDEKVVKEIVSIQYQSVYVPSIYNVATYQSNDAVCDRVIVIYKEFTSLE